MQNTSIVYHTESILEAQIISLIMCYLLTQSWSYDQSDVMSYGVKSNEVSPNAIMNFGLSQRSFTEVVFLVLFLEHIFSYTSGIFKTWELKTRGEPNEKGIESAKIGSILYWVEILIDVIIIVLIIIHFAQMDSIEVM